MEIRSLTDWGVGIAVTAALLVLTIEKQYDVVYIGYPYRAFRISLNDGSHAGPALGRTAIDIVFAVAITVSAIWFRRRFLPDSWRFNLVAVFSLVSAVATQLWTMDAGLGEASIESMVRIIASTILLFAILTFWAALFCVLRAAWRLALRCDGS
jgi:hypothetical protein